MKEAHKILFEPYSIGGLPIKNKFYMSPMGPSGMTDIDGAFTQTAVDYYAERAKGGVGLIITGDCFVENEIQETVMPSHVVPTWKPTCFIRTARKLTERVHSYGSKIFIQLSAGFGRVGHANTLSGDVIAPSPVEHRWVKGLMCREMTVEEIHTYVKRFGESAGYAKKAGFDGIEIHAIHEGYLLDQFTLALFNHRTDEYGGSLENRLRFAVEIVQEIKRVCGDDFPVGVRYSPKSFIRDLDDKAGGLPGQEFVELGRDMEEGLVVARMLQDAGYDFLDADVGSYESWHWSHPPMYHDKGMYLPYVSQLKDVVSIPVICSGRMDDADKSAAALRDGKIDMIGLGRPLLADPDYVNKLRRGKIEDIRPCLSCQEGCIGRIQHYSLINCAVNAQCAREKEYALNPVLCKKKVVIVGGGVAGMEAARVLKLRGHEPVLYEAADKLGGALGDAGVPSFKEDDIALIKWFAHTLEQLNVEVHLNTPVTPEMLNELDYDVLILATGAKAKIFNLGEDKPVYAARDVLKDPSLAGDRVVVIGGGMVGCEAALWLRKDLAKTVTVVEALPELLCVNAPSCSANRDMLAALIPFTGCDVKVNTAAVKTTETGLLVKNRLTDEEEEIPADTIILAVGFNSENTLAEHVSSEVEFYEIGDCRQFRNVHQAVWDAYEIANNL